MTTNWYWRRIRKNLNKVVRACQDILPEDRTSVYKCLQGGSFDLSTGFWLDHAVPASGTL